MAIAEPTKNNLDKMYLKASGFVSDVTSYTDKNTGKFKYNVELFIPGNVLMRVGLKEGTDPQVYERKKGDLITLNLKSREWNGKVFFTEA
ncbi:MAG: hypothetical protein D3920_00850 [Candidatus Electrothrix sp. AW2]|nr:hypothetical protein [Candidatus Electrothrix gigas]